MLIRSAIAASVALLAVAAPAAGAPAPREQHCVVHVLGQRASGELLATEPECFDEAADAAEAARRSPARTDQTGAMAAAAAASVIGVHYDGANFTGSSITITGTNCNGGWLNLSLSWRNRISSTVNGCPTIRHYDNINLFGARQDTFSPGGNLTTLNDRTDSVQYT